MTRVTHGGNRRRGRMGAFALVVLLSLVAAAVAAADQGDGAANVSRFQHIDLSTIGINDGSGAGLVPASLSTKPVSVMLKLGSAPVAARGKLSAAQKAAVRADLKAAQDAIRSDVEHAGATIVGQTQDAYNGILVHAQQKDLAALAAIPGVVAIQPVGIYAMPTNVNGVPLIGAPAAWARPTSLTGSGVTVGVIDTGIDYTHADFGGPGTPAAYQAAHAASTSAPDPSMFGPGHKVVGGTDFVGDDYDASTPAKATPHPDPNPLDCNGHGTHTSGTVAGYGVTAAGATYHGPYNASTDANPADWKVGPGVAPGASLRMYRVFGCEGSTDVAILAINQAVADGVDVISMSLGSPFGGSDQNDAELSAVNTAVAAGITVVASAGNDSTNGYIVGAPSTANHALSVAASDGSVATYPAGLLHLASGDITAINANGATFSNGLSGQVKVLRDATGGVSLGCNPDEYTSQGVSDKIVVVQRGTCARVARAIYGQKAGAKAVVMINNSATLPPFEGQITSNPDTGEQYTVTIPFFGVRGLAGSGADAVALVNADGQTITIDNSTTPNDNYKKTASFSSGGPRNGDSAAKPEITAPGVSVTSALVGGGTAGTVLSGTSMACPMTSGTAALVKQAHPTWNGDQIKAALVNTADNSLILNYNGRVNGTGFLQADKATDTDAIATTADGLDSLSFGYVSSASTSTGYTGTRDFTITNTGAAPITYNLSVSSNFGPVVSVSPSTLTVPAGGSATATVTLSITPAQFASLPGADSSVFGAITTIRGLVTAQPTTTGPGIQRLRLQWLAAPRGLSSVSATAPGSFVKQQVNNVYTSSTTVANSGVHSGAADFYAWGINDPNELGTAPYDIRDVGVQGPFAPDPDGNRFMVFAVGTYTPTSTQATQEYDVAIDLQRDGKPDYFVVGGDFGAFTTGTFDGRFASLVYDVKQGAFTDAWVADAPMNSSIAELPVTMADLGLKANASFTYSVTGLSIFGGTPDPTSAVTFDTAKPGVNSGMGGLLNPGQSAPVTLAADYDKLQSSPALGWLVANTDDAGGPGSLEELTLPALK